MKTIRAHHLLCIPRFYRGGYNKKFSKSFKEFCFDIRNNPNKKINLVKKSDDICKVCPHKKESICNKKPDINYWVNFQDKKVLEKLKLKENSTYKARDLFNLSINNITSKDLKEVCKGCEFLNSCLKYGINNSFKKDLNKN